jgi:DNA-directed RNA polymerase subunit N (RpoN/RPB10)
MLRVMNFPFEKTPFYLVGLKDMFNEIVEDGRNCIDYPQFFKYILGELVTIKEEEQNTEFQVQIQERKKQDYLLHDNGIKRICYSKDSRLLFSLDERANSIKIYDN